MAYNETYFDTIKDDLPGFTHLTVNDMLEHLQEQCLAMTFKEKKKKLKKINKILKKRKVVKRNRF